MASATQTVTRREMLRRGGLLTAGLACAGGLREIASGALAAPRLSQPKPPKWHSRPDLRIPALTVTRNEPGTAAAPIFIAPYNNPHGQQGAVIVDNSGQPIWENPIDDKVTANFQVQSYRGSPVLTWWEGSIELGHGVGEYVIADSSYRTVRRVQAAGGLRGDLHEFVITPRDTALLTSYVVRGADLRSVGGSSQGTIQDAIFQELDLATGKLLMEWHSLDHIPLSESYSPVSADWDYFHINSVALDDDSLLISARSTHTVYKIGRDGKIRWRLGGKSSDFSMGAGSNFAWQHDARRHADGTLTLFDNGATPAVEKRSRGLILNLDEQAMSATLLAQYTHPRILSGSQGSVQLLPGGNVFVGWGETPRVSEFDSSGRLLFDAMLGEEYQSYRAFRMPWTGWPAQAPALALKAGSGKVTAYASWNGATDVHHWSLLAGAQQEDLRIVSQTASRGFESALHTRAAGPWFAAQASQDNGQALGRSAPVLLSS
jgi:hypothetical protein